MQTDKNAIALFVKVAESGSFSKAAVREGVPVSTVSRKVAELEAALGVRLLERSTRGLRMTEVGQDYFERCRRGLIELEAAEALVTDRQAEISGRLRISIPPSMSDIVFLPLVRSFQELYPSVVVHCLVTERFIDHIADGIDLSLRVGEPKDSSLIATALTIHRPRLVASPSYLKNIKINHPLEILSHIKIAFSRWEKRVQWNLTKDKNTVQLNPEARIILNDYDGVLQGVLDGYGISELPWFICKPALEDERLIEVLPEWRFNAMKISAIYPSRYLSPLVRTFRDFCIKYFESRPLG